MKLHCHITHALEVPQLCGGLCLVGAPQGGLRGLPSDSQPDGEERGEDPESGRGEFRAQLTHHSCSLSHYSCLISKIRIIPPPRGHLQVPVPRAAQELVSESISQVSFEVSLARTVALPGCVHLGKKAPPEPVSSSLKRDP